MKIGFIGQGFIGKNLADNIEERGYKVVRYSLEEQYIGNKDAISGCDIVFIAVPTPSTPNGFHYSAVEEAISLVGEEAVAVIKSTILPNVARILSEKFPNKVIFASPEFLTEATARYDTDNPDRNIIGLSDVSNDELRQLAREVLNVLPTAPYSRIVTYEEASLVKYGGNCFFYTKNMFFNALYDLAESTSNVSWDNVQEAIVADRRIDPVHTFPLHKTGRGAGGPCLIKDFAAFVDLVEEMPDSLLQLKMLSANEVYNISLLSGTGKDLELLRGVYGDESTKG
jgi:UDP-glucose 6-dehydrogenase